MSYPPPGGPPPYWPPPPGHHPPPHHYPSHYPPHLSHHPPHFPPPPEPGHSSLSGTYSPYYLPAMMIPVHIPAPAGTPAETSSNPTYITNYIYHGENSQQSQAALVETAGDYDWVPTTTLTANHLTGKAVVGGHEGWDGSPLWVIRAWYNGDLIPGKFSIRHTSASVMHDGKEIPVQNMEVFCAKPESLRWIPASNGNIPPGAISGGQTASGETLYVGRARHQLSVTPGKIHPSHKTCYIGFAGSEVALQMYEVLCRIS